MNMLALETHPELEQLLSSLREDGGVIITDHGRPVAFVGTACLPKPPDMFSFRRSFRSPPSTVSEMAEIRSREKF